MGELPDNTTLLTRYLLGNLAPAEQETLEEAFFSDNDLFTKLLDLKDQLISDYLNGRLSSADRGRFERWCLASPDDGQEVELAGFLQYPSARQLLTRQSIPAQQPRPWWLSFFVALRAPLPLAGAALAVLLVISITGVWLSRQTAPTVSQPSSDSVGVNVPSGSAVVSIILKPTILLRDQGSSIPSVRLSAGTQMVELRCEVGVRSYPSYQGKLQRIDGGETQVLADNLKAETTADGNRIVIWRVPTAQLPIGDYQASLSGISPSQAADGIGVYRFKVRSQ